MTTSIQAVRSEAFIQSLGVNTHLGWLDKSYANVTTVEGALAYLGVDHVRDGVPVQYMLNTYQTLASAGIKFDICLASYQSDVNISGNLTLIDALANSRPGSVFSVEGPNELNAAYNNVTIDGQAATDPAVAVKIMQALYAAVKADPALKGTQVLNLSLTNGIAGWQQYNEALGNMSAQVDQGNWHVYFNNGDQPAANVKSMINDARQTAPGKPVTFTESGYFTAPGDNSGWGGVDQITQAKETLNDLADAFSQGVSQTYLYELLDNIPNPADTNIEDNWGLFLADGTPKLAGTAIHNLTAILADTDEAAQSFNASSLDYALSNLPANANSMLLQKSNGVYDLVVWAEPKIWDSVARKDVAAPTTTVTATFAAAPGMVQLFDPMAGTDATTLTNGTSVNFTLTDHPIILQISPTEPVNSAPVLNPAPVTPATVTLGSGTDILALSIAEDAWQGDAQFTISVDGKQVGGTQTATASHAAGATQLFDVMGSFGVGKHTTTINFLNDAYGGTATTDRNLHVESAMINGASVSGSTLTLFDSGPQSFSFNSAASDATDILDLHVSEDAWQGDAEFTVLVDGKTIGGVYSAAASHAKGTTQDVSIAGSWGAGAHTIGIAFINDAFGGSAANDRNLYVDQVAYNGLAASGVPAVLYSNGTTNFSVPAAIADTTLTLHMAEDAWKGDAQYSISIDGKAPVQSGVVTASNALGQSQAVTFQAVLSTGRHDVAVTLLNDAYGGTANTDRNLYVTGIDVNGTSVAGAAAALMSTEAAHFQILA